MYICDYDSITSGESKISCISIRQLHSVIRTTLPSRAQNWTAWLVNVVTFKPYFTYTNTNERRANGYVVCFWAVFLYQNQHCYFDQVKGDDVSVTALKMLYSKVIVSGTNTKINMLSSSQICEYRDGDHDSIYIYVCLRFVSHRTITNQEGTPKEFSAWRTHFTELRILLYYCPHHLPHIIFMHGIYNYIPETNHVFRVYSVAAVLNWQFLLQVMKYVSYY